MDDVGKGVVQGILCYNIRWLVMGGAASKHYSKYDQAQRLLLIDDINLISDFLTFLKSKYW